MLLKVVLFVAAAVVATALNEKDCTEVPGCLNEYQWKHKATQNESEAFCADRYSSCHNADGSDLKEYCPRASSDCVLFVYGYLNMTEEGKTLAVDFCKKRLPRC